MSRDDRDEPAVNRPSKSELKRQAQARYKLIESLAECGPGLLRPVQLSETTRAELRRIREMRPSQARKRSVKHLASQLTDTEWDAAGGFLADRQAHQAERNRQFHRIEQWRDRLLSDGDTALNELCLLHPETDRQHLRTLIRSAQNERRAGKPESAARKLFREIRLLIS